MDNYGMLAETKDFRGTWTRYTQDPVRRLELSRFENYDYASTKRRKVTREWHPTFRLPARIAQPLLITQFTYDSAGNLLTRTEQATTNIDGSAGFAAVLSGAPRTQTFTYNAKGQLLTATGPRTDVLEKTTYTYDALGNLATVTNSLGHTTSYANYDGDGRAGTITLPNGTSVQRTFTPRGWLATNAVIAGGVVQATVLEYDGVGQLTKSTNQDGSWSSYSYNDAHQMTRVADSAGNSIDYTLDLRGNRIREQVKDPAGTLRRQMSRVFDKDNRLKQQTGAAQ